MTERLAAPVFLLSMALVLFELVLTRLFGIVLFANFAHVALGLAMLGISLGAVLQHVWPGLVPDQGLARRLGWLSLAQGATTLLATAATLWMPLTRQYAESPETYTERSDVAWELVQPGWLVALLFILTVPFAISGLAFAGVFQRRKADIGRLYGADLVGGALAAVLFLPLLSLVPGPDTAFFIAGLSALGAALAFRGQGGRRLVAAASGLALLGSALSIASASGLELLKVRYSAGYSEQNIFFAEWTPLTRIAFHKDERGTFAVLDNSSASQVVLEESDQQTVRSHANRAMVYALHEPGARIAILAASAGPEVAAAQSYGHTDIDAIDIAAIGELVQQEFPGNALNPYLRPGVRLIVADARSAMMHTTEPYDIIQMVHANLHSSAGLLANAWSSALLETTEAFGVYLDRLNPDGTLSFGRGSKTRRLARAAAVALQARGFKNPEQHVLYLQGHSTFMLVKKRPWTEAERDKALALLPAWPGEDLYMDPLAPSRSRVSRTLLRGPVLTDDRPYLDDPEEVWKILADTLSRLRKGGTGEVEPSHIVYHTLAIQVLFVLGAGVLLLGLPLLRRTGPKLPGRGPALLYIAGLGYGYLAVETVLVHELALFVGHPTYALTVVVLSMLSSSGIGAMAAARVPEARLVPALRGVLVLVLILGMLQAWVVPSMLGAVAMGSPILVRAVLTGVVLVPIGFVMGMPFPLAMRSLPDSGAGIVPWAWALNGWTSVVASLATVIIARFAGYGTAMMIALSAYVVALLVAGAFARVRPA